MSLRVTNTNAGDDSDGRIWGIEGANLLILLVAAVISVATALVLHRADWHLALTVPVAMTPLVLAVGYVFGLRQGKPPGYDADMIEQLVNGSGWECDPQGQPLHPLPKEMP